MAMLNSATTLLSEQYGYVQGSRRVLLDYCAQMQPDDLLKTPEHFGRGSICHTLVHVANVYEFWIGLFPKNLSGETTKADSITGIRQLESLYATIDQKVRGFLMECEMLPEKSITALVPWLGVEKSYSSLQLMTHVMTHEYHHKGQIMTMGRILGYAPPDADIIRF